MDTIGIMAAIPEFTAVILAATTGARLFPLTSPDTPKHLLPIAGVPVVVRLIHSLSASGFKQCIVALASSDKSTVTLLKKEVDQDDMFQGKMKVIIFSLSNDCSGSAEALRQVNDLVSEHSNLVVLPGDLVVMETFVMTQLVNAHRQSNLPPNNMSSAFTMLLADVGEQDENGIPLKESSKQKKGGLAREEEDIEYIALSYSPKQQPRVLWKQSKIDVEEDEDMVGQAPKLILPKPRLRVPGECVRVSRDWTDLHVYVLSPWLRTLIQERRSMMSFQGDGIPLCVSRQFRGVRQTFGGRVDRTVVDEIFSSPFFAQDDATSLSLKTSTDEYAVRAHLLNGWKALRVSTIPSYHYACKEVMTLAVEDNQSKNPCLSLPPKTKKNDKFHWIALEGSAMGEKVQCRSSTIGRRSKISDKCRLNNVVVMDDVTIGESCVIQNSIIGAGSIIAEKCSLNDCQVAPGKSVPPMTKEKGESLIDDSM